MGQLRDFTMDAAQGRAREREAMYQGSPYRRGRSGLKISVWLKQVIWSCMFFAAVSGVMKLDNDWSRTTQQLLFTHLNMETDLLPVLQPLYFHGGEPPTGVNGMSEDQNGSQGEPSLFMPISGIVLQNFTVGENGTMTVDSVTIKTPNGGKLINACAGQVATIAGDVGNWQVVIVCENGRKTVYSGVKNLAVTAGQEIAAGAVIGSAVEGEIRFALYENEQPLDPMPYFRVNE